MVANTNQSQNTALTTSATGKTVTVARWRSFHRSERRPTSRGDQRSPNMWIAKIEPAIAVARIATGTVSKISVFTGPVDRKIRNIEAARATFDVSGSLAEKATYAIGAVSSELSASIPA